MNSIDLSPHPHALPFGSEQIPCKLLCLMFLAKERLANRETAELLSCNDLVEIMRHKLPTKIETDDDLVAMIEDRHRRRQTAMDHAYQKQALMLEASACGGI